jgi:predicted HicB family RNase H-like nuclease
VVEPRGSQVAAAGQRLARYRVELCWSDDDRQFVADIPAFGPGISAAGASPGKALDELEIVLGAVEESYRENGWPLPGSSVHSGQLRIRMPRSLHARLASAAGREGVSLNTLIVSYLVDRVATNAPTGSRGGPGLGGSPTIR